MTALETGSDPRGQTRDKRYPPDRPEPAPLVGVVVPMWNAAETIDATLAVLSAQAYKNLDVVIVDDGSTDNSPAIAHSWVRKDPRFRLLRQSNLGVAAARNLGAANTTAAYLAFIDADDLWGPEKIDAQMLAIASGRR